MRATKIIRVQENMTYWNVGRIELFSLVKKRMRRDLIQASNTKSIIIKKKRRW